MSEQVRRLGERYELGEVIGRGGMAEVHEGQDLRLGRRVAVKILRPDLARDPSFQARFRREAQSAASLNHPNIVAVYDTGEDILGATGSEPGTVVPYIVMEYVDGMTLRQLMSSGRRLLPERAMEIADGTLAALDYSHRHGIVHRDIKPANVMLTRGGDVKVMDFGIARALADAGQTMTATSAVMGTAQYLSPEQARGELVDSRSDIYSTSCLVYELLTGRPPFTGDSPVSVVYQHVSEAPVPPSQLDPSVPTPIDAIVLKGLAKRPDDRYQTAADMRADVERAIAGLPVTAALAPVTANPMADTAALPMLTGSSTGPLHKRSPWAWVGIAVGIAVVATAAVILGKMLFGTPAVEQVTVPPLSGLTVAQATAELSQVGLILGHQTPEASVDRPKDRIISQNPPSGQQID
ncbi:MAG: Stk1 family PASTA domain-containing Ser/Thr kinase, partial [Candidatus Nanopelagicales bacterium]